MPSVAFFKAGTTTPLAVYSDPALSKPLAQPVRADGTGRFPRIYLPTALYAERVSGPYGNLLWFDDGLGTVPPTTGGGEGGTVDPTAIAATGDAEWRMDAGIMPGVSTPPKTGLVSEARSASDRARVPAAADALGVTLMPEPSPAQRIVFAVPSKQPTGTIVLPVRSRKASCGHAPDA